jgi:uncharacterized RDD family membrane protein YckC
MPCPFCGDICRCSPSEANAAASPRWLADATPCAGMSDAQTEMAREESASLPLAESRVPPENVPPENVPQEGTEQSEEGSTAWRQEVAARLNRYQARRKPRPPRYPSLRLRFEEEPAPAASSISGDSQLLPQRNTASYQALALDTFTDNDTRAEEIAASTPVPSLHAQVPQQTTFSAPPTAKIIEFPRSWTPAPPPLDELAEPVLNSDRPRILEAPDVVAPPPALGGITIEPVQQPELEKRPGIDIPLRSAPLGRRIFAAVTDGVIIAIAGVLFGFIFWKMTAIRPPRIQVLGFAAGLSGVFWAAYQYLLVVYSGATPGLRLARLELARFDGSHAGRRLRRWRVLASFLSAASLGMGYAWVFLDEDSLCWHDRITHTYLAPRK